MKHDWEAKTIPRKEFIVVCTVLLSAFFTGCGGGGSSPVGPPLNPNPTLASLSPSGAVAGGAAFTLTVNGSNFIFGSTVQWNGSNRTTTFSSASQITASITATDIAAAGTTQVTVFNPAPGGGTSNSVAFAITAPFDANDNNNYNDIYVRDTCVSGTLPGCTPSTFLGSATNNPAVNNGVSNVPGSGGADHPAISGNGRFVTFSSDASDMVANDINSNADIFVRDTCFGVTSGCSPSTFIASVSTAGVQDLTSGSFSASVSDDGRFVAFTSDNLVPGDTNGFVDIYVRDTCVGGTLSGCSPSTAQASVAGDGSAADQSGAFPKLSRDGHAVVFSSAASNLVPSDTNAAADAFLAPTSF